MSPFYEPETFVEHVVHNVGLGVFIFFPTFLLSWLPLRVVFGGVEWLIYGTFSTVSLCTLTSSTEILLCRSETGAIGLDQIVNWFIQSDLLYVFSSVSGVLILMGMRFWTFLLRRIEVIEAIKRIRKSRESLVKD